MEQALDFVDATIHVATTFAWGWLWISLISLAIYGVILALDEIQYRSLSKPIREFPD